jgi:hypothetical protein
MMNAPHQTKGLLLRAESSSRSAIHLGYMQGSAPDRDLVGCHNHRFHHATDSGGAVMVILESAMLEGIVLSHLTVELTR